VSHRQHVAYATHVTSPSAFACKSVLSVLDGNAANISIPLPLHYHFSVLSASSEHDAANISITPPLRSQFSVLSASSEQANANPYKCVRNAIQHAKKKCHESSSVETQAFSRHIRSAYYHPDSPQTRYRTGHGPRLPLCVFALFQLQSLIIPG